KREGGAKEKKWEGGIFLGGGEAPAPSLSLFADHPPRLKNAVGAVRCPNCRTGCLEVRPGDWHQFVASTAITWYWPDWSRFDSDGTLHVKASGYQGDSHWTGENVFIPEQPEYGFWWWVLAQDKDHAGFVHVGFR